MLSGDSKEMDDFVAAWEKIFFEQFELSFTEEKYLAIDLGTINFPIVFISALNLGNLKDNEVLI